MDELVKISLLLDFYGQMLTERQYEILDLHYNNDYSLGEIAQMLSISRQGVHDNIKRGKAALFDMESKLGLVARFGDKKDKASRILTLLESIDQKTFTEQDRQRLTDAKHLIISIMED
jgi:predicted DNA-binding protein YlxM (UPF0122 family)